MKLLVQCLAVGGAGFVGSVSRFLIGVLSGRLLGSGFPWGTMLINLSGSFFLGWFATMATGRMSMNENLRIAVAVGFVGAYTTFSTLMFDSQQLASNGAWVKFAGNLAGSFVLGMIAVWLGVRLAAR